MNITEKLFWGFVTVVLSPLVLLSWIGKALSWPYEKVTDFINRIFSPWG